MSAAGTTVLAARLARAVRWRRCWRRRASWFRGAGRAEPAGVEPSSDGLRRGRWSPCSGWLRGCGAHRRGARARRRAGPPAMPGGAAVPSHCDAGAGGDPARASPGGRAPRAPAAAAPEPTPSACRQALPRSGGATRAGSWRTPRYLRAAGARRRRPPRSAAPRPRWPDRVVLGGRARRRAARSRTVARRACLARVGPEPMVAAEPRRRARGRPRGEPRGGGADRDRLGDARMRRAA